MQQAGRGKVLVEGDATETNQLIVTVQQGLEVKFITDNWQFVFEGVSIAIVVAIVGVLAFSRFRRLSTAIRGKPLSGIVTICVLLLLFFHLKGSIKVDGWAIALLLIALVPWSWTQTLSALSTVSDAFAKSSLKSFQLGSFKIEQLEQKVDEHTHTLDQQRRMLDDLILYSMSFYIYEKLKHLHLGTLEQYKGQFGEYKYVSSEVFNHDLRYLRDHGYINFFQMSDLTPGENLVGRLRVTEMGGRFVEMKEARLRLNEGDKPRTVSS